MIVSQGLLWSSSKYKTHFWVKYTTLYRVCMPRLIILLYIHLICNIYSSTSKIRISLSKRWGNSAHAHETRTSWWLVKSFWPLESQNCPGKSVSFITTFNVWPPTLTHLPYNTGGRGSHKSRRRTAIESCKLKVQGAFTRGKYHRANNVGLDHPRTAAPRLGVHAAIARWQIWRGRTWKGEVNAHLTTAILDRVSIQSGVGAGGSLHENLDKKTLKNRRVNYVAKGDGEGGAGGKWRPGPPGRTLDLRLKYSEI